jgi:hypothetical protein
MDRFAFALVDAGTGEPCWDEEEFAGTELELIGADSMQAGTGSRQNRVGIRAADGVAVRFPVRAAKRTVPLLIFCIGLGFWVSAEGANADSPRRAGARGAQSSASAAWVRIANGRRLTNEWAEGFPSSNAKLAVGGNRILESTGVALFVSGLSPYLLQGSSQQRDSYAGLQGSDEFQRAGEQHQFPLRLESLAWLFFFGFVSWRGTVWMERR